MTARPDRFPFAAVVGQDDAKLALLLLAVDPLIGGVLLRGDKGSAKTTLARGLADLLPGGSSFVDLPLGATEDRLIGTLDLAKALVDQELAFTPGLLAAADGGVLYVDEVNLLADHLVDTLLDVSVSGTNRVERDGISHEHDARFVLIGSMNPEEGELRPQLLDRFGLSVTVVTSSDPGERAEAVRRRLAHDAPGGRASSDETTDAMDALRSQLDQAKPASISDELVVAASKLALAVGAEGLRADIVLCRAAAAFAGLDGRDTTTEADLRRVAPLVLAHRARRNPFDPPVLPPDELSRALDELTDDFDNAPDNERENPAGSDDADDREPPSDTEAPGDAGDDEQPGESETTQPMSIGTERRPAPSQPTSHRRGQGGPDGRAATVQSNRGRMVRDVAASSAPDSPIAVAATVRHIAQRRGVDGGSAVDANDVRHAIRERTASSLVILVVDTSGSMGAQARAEAATGTAFGLLSSAYERRDHVAVIQFGGDGANIVLQPTGSVEVARHRMSALHTGGVSPLADALRLAMEVASSRREQDRVPFIALLSDGRATGSETAFDEALLAAEGIRHRGIGGIVLDCETGTPRLDLANRLAEALAMPCVDATALDAAAVTSAIRATSRAAIDCR